MKRSFAAAAALLRQRSCCCSSSSSYLERMQRGWRGGRGYVAMKLWWQHNCTRRRYVPMQISGHGGRRCKPQDDADAMRTPHFFINRRLIAR